MSKLSVYFFLASETKGDKKVTIPLTILEMKAYSLPQSIIVATKPVQKTYKQLVDAMKSYTQTKSFDFIVEIERH